MIWRWQQAITWLEQYNINPKMGVEVGCKHGRFTYQLLSHFPDLIMTMIDPLEIQPNGAETYEKWNWGKIKSELDELLNAAKGRAIFLQSYSADAADLIPDHSQDFVFIDAQHDFASACEDIQLWKEKIKPGGLIMGHDYCAKFPGVINAVTFWFDVNEIITGENDTWMVKL